MKIKVTEQRNIFWSEKSYEAESTAKLMARTKGAEKCVYDYYHMKYIAEKINFFLQ